MVEEFEYKGTWFLPERSRKRVNGILTFAPSGGAELQLDGVLSEYGNDKYSFTMIQPEIILGYFTTG